MENKIKISCIWRGINVKNSLYGIPIVNIDIYKDSYYNETELTTTEIENKVKSFGIVSVCIDGIDYLDEDSVKNLLLTLSNYVVYVHCYSDKYVNLINSIMYNGFPIVESITMEISKGNKTKKDLEKFSCLTSLKMKDEVAFVLDNEEDYDFMMNVLQQYKTQSSIIVYVILHEEKDKHKYVWAINKILDDMPVELRNKSRIIGIDKYHLSYK